MWAALARIIIRHRLAILIALGAITALMAYQARGVRLYYGLPRMLPDDDPALIAYDRFSERFKEETTVFVIGIEKDLFSDVELFNKWYKLGRSISSIEGVDTVLSVGSAFNIVKDTAAKRFLIEPIVRRPLRNAEELDSIRNVFANLPFYRDLLYNSGNNYSLMAISMRNERFNSPERSEFFGSILDKVSSFEEENNLDIKYSGMPYIREMMTSLIKQELKLFILLTLIVTILILYIFFRSVLPVLIAMGVVGLGVVWSLGTINTLGYEITILTSLIPPLIIVIGIPNCIYLINKFHAELKEHGNMAKALVRVVSKIGKATFMTNATTATGFLTFTFTQSIILVEFGIVAFLSIMFLFMLSILGITIAFSYLPPPKESLTDHVEKTWITTLIGSFIYLVTHQRKWVYVGSAIVALVSFYGLTKIQTTGNIVDDLPRDHTIVTDLKWFEKNFGGVVPFEIEVDALKPRQVLNTRILHAIDKTEELFAADTNFSRPLSIVDALKFVRQAFYNGNPQRYGLITSREKAFFKEYIENAEKDQGLLYTYIDSTHRYARISMQVADLGTIQMDSLLSVMQPKVDHIFNPKRQKQDSLLSLLKTTPDGALKDSLYGYLLSRNSQARKYLQNELQVDSLPSSINRLDAKSADNLVSMLDSALAAGYINLNFTGPSITFLKGTNYLVRNLFVSLSIAIVIVALLMAAVFNSMRMIVVSVLTNLLPLLFTAGIMGYFGVAIKPSTLLVFSIAFGISVDDTIHYLAKYRQELKHWGDDIGKSVYNALRETGVSMVYTSIILFFGFSVFDLSQFGGTQALGILVSMTLLVAMFSNLILLPSFLMSFERMMVTKWFKEPLIALLDEEEDLELDELDFDENVNRNE
ncbi:MAG: hypothetical protein Kow0075_01920 [Salibacteraceae bacterium]